MKKILYLLPLLPWFLTIKAMELPKDVVKEIYQKKAEYQREINKLFEPKASKSKRQIKKIRKAITGVNDFYYMHMRQANGDLKNELRRTYICNCYSYATLLQTSSKPFKALKVIKAMEKAITLTPEDDLYVFFQDLKNTCCKTFDGSTNKPIRKKSNRNNEKNNIKRQISIGDMKKEFESIRHVYHRQLQESDNEIVKNDLRKDYLCKCLSYTLFLESKSLFQDALNIIRSINLEPEDDLYSRFEDLEKSCLNNGQHLPNQQTNKKRVIHKQKKQSPSKKPKTNAKEFTNAEKDPEEIPSKNNDIDSLDFLHDTLEDLPQDVLDLFKED